MSRFEGSVQEQKAPACRRRTWYAGRPAWACRAAGTINAGRGAPAAGQPHLTPLLLRVPQAPPPTLPRAGPSSSLPPHLSLFLSSLARSRSLPQSLSSPPPPNPHSLLSSLPISPSVAESPLPLQRTAEGGCCRLLDFCTRAGCAASAATAAAAAAAAGAATAAAAAAAAGGGRREPPAASGESPTGPCRGVGRGGFKSSYLGSVAKP